ncbi:hypothetical protein CPB84DRAFT_1850084 [Gymnopilus junonius]|uniref:Uncharacterized protein n=1 Tax=Gymnopilus junonius TaxID=109634 RepID=A0A9P5TKB7_GYMJU|nr:hypothetical protein CPB84DRAFT_1850084 [Gymnopilus junonius]
MSSTPSVTFIREVFIDVYLNSVLLGTLLMVQEAGQWFLLRDAVVNQGATRKSIYVAIFTSPIWVSLLTSISIYSLAFLADTLLIWRCFNVWNRSLRVILFPLVTLFAEGALFLTVIIFSSAVDLSPSNNQAIIFNRLIAAGLFMTLVTSVVTTLLISYRIYSVAGTKDALPGSKRRFKHVVEILTESAAVYSVVAIMLAVVTIIPQTSNAFAPLLGAQDMISILFVFTAGCAPTIMVARVALATDSKVDTSVHISGLQFQSKSTVLGVAHFERNSFDSENNGFDAVPNSRKVVADQCWGQVPFQPRLR